MLHAACVVYKPSCLFTLNDFMSMNTASCLMKKPLVFLNENKSQIVNTQKITIRSESKNY